MAIIGPATPCRERSAGYNALMYTSLQGILPKGRPPMLAELTFKVVFEYEEDAEGTTRTKAFEWK